MIVLYSHYNSKTFTYKSHPFSSINVYIRLNGTKSNLYIGEHKRVRKKKRKSEKIY